MVSLSVDRAKDVTLARQRVTRLACQDRVPRLSDRFVVLREISPHDAASLMRCLDDAQVSEYLSRGPANAAAFEDFARWAREQRAAGAYICFAIVPAGSGQAVGLIQLWPVESNWSIAEWGFVLGRDFWGTGLFPRAAHLALQFAFEALGVERLEARTVVGNERANAALRKLGAMPEGILRHGFDSGTERVDSLMWSILPGEYQAARAEANSEP